MKKILFVLLFVMHALAVFPQDQKIFLNSFEHDPFDTAMTFSPKKDSNGNPYALVKVRPYIQGLILRFDGKRVVDDGEHDGERWFYVQKDANKVSISLNGYTAIDKKDLGLTLASGQTYVMRLSYSAPEVKKQILQFVVQPEGVDATVIIHPMDETNFEFFGRTSSNSGMTKKLTYGNYAYQVMADKYVTAEGTVTLDNDRETKIERVTLVPNVAEATPQKLKISLDKFQHVPSDNAAKSFPKRDINGDLYALVKVRPYVQGLELDFSYLKAVDDGEHKGEHWFYVQKEARNVTISSNGYTSIRNKSLGKPLEPGQTYVMDLSYTALETKKQLLKFVVQPKGIDATVMIRPMNETKYEYLGSTGSNSDVSKKLAHGNYAYRVMAEKYVSAEGSVTLDNDHETKIEHATLAPDFAMTTLCVDADADIYIDNELKGCRIWAGTLEAGPYNVETRMDKHRASFDRIDVQRGKAQIFRLTPPVPITGTVSVFTAPSGAKIELDGREYGKTPYNITDILIGQHQLTLSMPNYRRELQTVIVEEGKMLEIKTQLSPLKQNTVYVQPILQVGSAMGVGGGIGAYLRKFNVELSYLSGLAKSETVYWNYTDSPYTISETYKPKSSIGGKVGYVILRNRRLRITPQIGVSVVSIDGPQTGNGYAVAASFGARGECALTSFMGVYLAPEYDFAISQSDFFKTVSNVSSKVKGNANGFNCRLGIYFYL